MLKEAANKTVLGFESANDYLSTILGGSQNKLFICFISFYGAINSIITNYIYDDAKAVYFLFILLALDCLTAIYRSYKLKSFSSKRLPRVLLVAVSYAIGLALAWNAAKYSPLFIWLPPLIYNGFVAVNLVSIFENLIQVGLLPKTLLTNIISKLKKTSQPDEKDEKGNDPTA